jgi:hypothetical protein
MHARHRASVLNPHPHTSASHSIRRADCVAAVAVPVPLGIPRSIAQRENTCLKGSTQRHEKRSDDGMHGCHAKDI